MAVRRLALWLSALCAIVLACLPMPVSGQGTVYVAIRHVDLAQFPQVTLYVRLADENGRPLRGVQAADVTLQEDGKPVSAAQLEEVSRSEPLYIALAIDTSGSMSGRGIEAARAAATRFVESLQPDDQVAVFSFDKEVVLRCDYTADRATLRRCIENLSTLPRGTGYTLLYRAAFETIQKAAEKPIGQRLALIVSDGRNEEERPALTIDDVIEQSSKKAVPVFTIAIDRGQSREWLAEMERLALISGGIPYRLDAGQVEALLPEQFAAITELLGWQYRIAYTSAALPDESSHTLTVRLRHGGSTASGEYTFRAPRVPPDICLSGLTTQGQVRGKVTLAASECRGVPLKQVEFLLDGNSLGTVETAPFTLLWDSAKASAGSHSLTVRAVDQAGNAGEKTFPVEVVPPIRVQIVAPADGAVVEPRLRVDISVDSVAPIAQVEYFFDGFLVARSEQLSPTMVLDLRHFSRGPHTLRVTATDGQGNEGTAQLSVVLRTGAVYGYLLGALGAVLVAGAVIAAVAVRRSRRRVSPAPAETMVTPVPSPAAGPIPPQAPPAGTLPSIPPAGLQPGREDATRVRMPTVGTDATRISPAVRGPHEAETELMEVLPPATAWLVVREGAAAGRQFPLHGERTFIGRRPDCQIVLADPAVSNRHAVVIREGDTFLIQDLASTNGTFVQGERITGPRELQEGDQIRMGNSVLVFKRL